MQDQIKQVLTVKGNNAGNYQITFDSSTSTDYVAVLFGPGENEPILAVWGWYVIKGSNIHQITADTFKLNGLHKIILRHNNDESVYFLAKFNVETKSV